MKIRKFNESINLDHESIMNKMEKVLDGNKKEIEIADQLLTWLEEQPKGTIIDGSEISKFGDKMEILKILTYLQLVTDGMIEMKYRSVKNDEIIPNEEVKKLSKNQTIQYQGEELGREDVSIFFEKN